jgi:hypothetical protein
MKISLIIKECPEEILITLAIVLKFSSLAEHPNSYPIGNYLPWKS